MNQTEQYIFYICCMCSAAINQQDQYEPVSMNIEKQTRNLLRSWSLLLKFFCKHYQIYRFGTVI